MKYHHWNFSICPECGKKGVYVIQTEFWRKGRESWPNIYYHEQCRYCLFRACITEEEYRSRKGQTGVEEMKDKTPTTMGGK